MHTITIIGKTADVTVDQMMINDMLHKESMAQCALSKVECEEESVVEKGALATGMATVVVRSSRKDDS